jgi:hypothetical protein
MHRAIHATALVLVLAAQTASGGCEDTGTPGYDCHVSERGLQVENGYVTDVVRNWCEVGLAPQRQTFITWIETRRNPDDRWLVSGRSSPSDDVPDSDGVTHVLRDGRCQHDIEYGMAWHASGADHNGVPFDTGIVRRIPGRTDLC